MASFGPVRRALWKSSTLPNYALRFPPPQRGRIRREAPQCAIFPCRLGRNQNRPSPDEHPLNRDRRLNGQCTDAAGVGIIDRIGIMFADRAEFTRDSPAGPQKFHAVARTAFGTDAFRRFFAEANGLNALDSLFGFAVSLFCLHCQISTLKFGVGRPMGPRWPIYRKNAADQHVTADFLQIGKLSVLITG